MPILTLRARVFAASRFAWKIWLELFGNLFSEQPDNNGIETEASMSPAGTLDRREFLKKSAAGGTALVIGFYLPSKYEELTAGPPSELSSHHARGRLRPTYKATAATA